MGNARRRILFGALGALAITCGSDDMGNLLVDAGHAIDGALGEGDAQAEPTEHTLTCDTTYTYTTDYQNGTVMAYTTYYAVKNIGVAPQDYPDIRVLMCDYQDLASPATSCPDGAVCTGSYAPPNQCQLSSGGGFRDGNLVVYCGYRQQMDYASTPSATYGYRWNSVKVQVR